MSETYTVRQLCDALSAAVSTAFPDEVWVKGSISSLSRSGNGHVYFDLVEPSEGLGSAPPGLVPVTLFATDRARVNHILRRSGQVRMSDGVEIRIRGRVAYYPPQGRIQVRMSLIDPAYTVGQMAATRQALLTQLAAEGLLDANRMLDLPVPPLRVGLVTSDRSAAHADFVHELAQSRYPFEVELFDCRVQGVDAVPSLVEALTRAGQRPLDVVVVIRGGGARTDLAAFDHERVARAITTCPRPVLVGVGHEIDRSVADEVAHTSAKTPTATAAVLVDAVARFDRQVEQSAARLAGLAGARLDAAAGHLTGTGGRLVAASRSLLTGHDGHLERQATQLRHRAERGLDHAGAGLDRAELRLRALDPAAVLARGWSITHTATGSLVRRAGAAPAGTILVTTLASGRLTSTVTAAEDETSPSSAPSPPDAERLSETPP